MGTQFFWFFDIVLVAIAVGTIVKAARKGFVASIVGFVAIFVSFIIAFPLSDTISAAVYDNIIEDALVTEMNNTIGESIDSSVVAQLDKIEMSKATLNGYKLSDITLTPDSAGRINLDLSALNLSETGISDMDLSVFGLDSKTVDYSSINLGTVQISQSELEQYGIETMILANLLTNKISTGTLYGNICSAVEQMANSVPQLMGDFSQSINAGDQSAIKSIVLSIIEAEADDFAESILDNTVKPVLLVPVRALIFFVLFALLMFVLNLVVKALKIVNKIPVLGGLNVLLGIVLGTVEAVITIFIVCIGVQVVVTLTNNSLIFLNTMTIDQTVLFRYVYYFDFLNFLG